MFYFLGGGGGVKILNFNILGGLKKLNSFLGSKDFADMFFGSSNNKTELV